MTPLHTLAASTTSAALGVSLGVALGWWLRGPGATWDRSCVTTGPVPRGYALGLDAATLELRMATEAAMRSSDAPITASEFTESLRKARAQRDAQKGQP